MCGNRHRAMRRQQQMSLLSGAHLTGATPFVNNTRASPVAALVEAVGNMALKANQIQPQQPTSTPISVPAPAYNDMEKGAHVSEEPPAYERVVGNMAPEVVTREISQSTYNTVNDQHQASKSIDKSALSPQVSRLIEALTAAVTAHQAGFGRRKHVRRAQKALRNELYEAEVARRQAMHGRLRCGERCEIWREIKAMNFGY